MATSLSDDTPAVLVATVNQVPQFLDEATSCWLPTNRSVGEAGRKMRVPGSLQTGWQAGEECQWMHRDSKAQGEWQECERGSAKVREGAWQHEEGVMRIGECA